MLGIRMVAVGAVLVMAVGGAAAQTAATSTPGKPISLLQVSPKPHKAKPRLHTRTARRPSTRTNHVARKSTHHVAPAQTAEAPASVWPSLVPPPPAPAPVAAAEPAPPPAPVASEPAPSELVVGGRTVQVAAPEAVNDIDLAADKKVEKTDDAAAAAVAPNSDVPQAKPAVQAMVATPAHTNPIGSPSWIAQVLAAFGGAVAAGSVAWFLIGSTPQRMQG